MTGHAINAKSEAVELYELSSAELDAVSGGDKATAAQQKQAENKQQADAVKAFQQVLQGL